VKASLAAGLLRQKTLALFVHLISYDAVKSQFVKDTQFRLRIPNIERRIGPRCFHLTQMNALPFSVKEGPIASTVSPLDEYHRLVKIGLFRIRKVLAYGRNHEAPIFIDRSSFS